MKSLFGWLFDKGPTVKISEIKQRQFQIIDRCNTCARDESWSECREHREELAGVGCWRPRGTILIWDERSV
jgi:hypothetical protein